MKSATFSHNHCPVCIYADLHQLSAAAAKHCVELINQSIVRHGVCHLALAGGSTPAQLYALLATPAYAQQIDWDKVHVYFGDERYVAHTDTTSNFYMARTTLLDNIPIPAQNIHPIPTAAQSAAFDAQTYAELLTTNLPVANQMPEFDLILLGMGEDGHTASLFPDSAILNETAIPVAAVYVEKLESWRISLTYPVLNAARCVLFLVSGHNKAVQIARIFSDQHEVPVPVQRVQPQHACFWYLDVAAASQLERDT